MNWPAIWTRLGDFLGPRSWLGRLVVGVSQAGARWIRCILCPLAAAAAFIRLVASGLLRSAFAVIFVPIVAALLYDDAGSDYILGLALDPTWPRWTGSVLWVSAWVVTTWFWSTVALATWRFPFAPPLSRHRQRQIGAMLQTILPTTIALAAAFVVAAGFLHVARPLAAQAAGAAAEPAYAHQINQAATVLRAAAAGVGLMAVALLAAGNFLAPRIVGAWAGSPYRDGAIILWRFIVTTIGAVIVAYFLIASTTDPVGTSAFWGGALNLLLVAAMAWVGFGTTLILLGDSWQFPVAGGVLLWFAIVTSTNHQHVMPKADVQPATRTLETALDAWQKRGTPSRPLVLVATAGGGMRAAYWTATVLGTAHDTIPAFGNALFAISGVSGGSVGATVYAAVAAHAAEGCGTQPAAFAPCTQKILAVDLLGPTIAGLAFTDVAQAFIPTAAVQLPDRAQALEDALAAGWAPAPNTPNPFNAPLSALYQQGANAPVPELLLNGTSVHTGTRLITASLRTPPGQFPGAIDAAAVFGIDPPLSAAGLNSARFPYVTPVAVVGTGAAEDEIGDGGYFENFGAATAQDVLHWLRAKLGPAQKIIVLSISSDDTLPHDPPFWPDPKQCTDQPNPPPGAPLSNFLSQATAPILALANGRGAHGNLAAWRLLQAAQQDNAVFIPFRLTRAPGQPGVPLSWYLSDPGRSSIKQEFDRCADQTALRALKTALSP